MAPVILLLILVVPLAELAVIVQTAERIGVPSTLGLLILVSVAGAWLLKHEGMATWKRLQETLQRGEMPHRELTDGAMILFGGALLLTPGFLTDVVGLILLVPPTRSSVKGLFRRVLGRWAHRRFGVNPVREARVVRVERKEASPRRSRGDLPSGEGDSRDTP